MAQWRKVKLRYRKEDESGSLKTHNEEYLLDSVSFTEAEARAFKTITTGTSDFTVTSITKMSLADLFTYEDGEKWFKCKVIYYSVDEASGKEKKVVNYMLVNADGIGQALERITENLRTMLIPYETTDINLTNILDVFPYQAEPESDPVTISERRVFAQKPTTPYDNGDLWKLSNEVMMKSTVSREEDEEFHIEDWEETKWFTSGERNVE